jgi:hypothetical protein
MATCANQAFKAWRDVLEDDGLFIFMEAFKDDRFSGFCLHGQIFRVIYDMDTMLGQRVGH